VVLDYNLVLQELQLIMPVVVDQEETLELSVLVD
jgi:hypothetical protein